MSTKALEHYLKPLRPLLAEEGVTELCINQTHEVFVEKFGQFVRHDVAELDSNYLEALVVLIAEFNHKNFPAPLLSGSLPTGERVQFVMSPACEKDKAICSIRKHQERTMTLDDYVEQGVFAEIKNIDQRTTPDEHLKKTYQQNDIYNFIKLAVQLKKNILISGGTGTGKTTFLNACLKHVPQNERLITVEDTREVNVTQSNKVHLLFNEEDERINALNIFKICLRLRPDRIFLSELRGKEVWPYLRAANSGHPGSLSTVHADTPEGAFTQLVFMMQQAGSTSSEEQIRNYIKSIIHIVIQLKRDTNKGRFMYVSDIYFNGI